MGFLRGLSIAMGANLIVFVLSFFNNKLMYVSLSKEDNGLFFLIMRLSLFIPLFFGEWLRLSSLNVAGRDKQNIPVLSANGMWYSIFIGLVLICVSLSFPSFLSGDFLGIPLHYLPVPVLVGCIFIARNNWQSLLLVNHKMISYGLTYVLWSLLFLVLNVLFLVFFDFKLRHVITSFIIATVIGTLWAFFSNMIHNRHTFRPSLEILKISGKIGLRAWMASLGMFLMTDIYVFMIRPLIGTKEMGYVMLAIFSICYRIYILFQRVFDVVGTVLYSHVVQEDVKTSHKMTMLVTRNSLLVSILLILIAVIFGKILIIIISDSTYLSAYIPMLIMLPGIIAINVGSVINSFFWGRNYPLRTIVAPYIAALLGFVFNILFIPRIGVAGATLSFSLMSIIWFIFLTIYFIKDSGFKLYDVLVPCRADFIYMISRINHLLSGRRK
ncbi:MAG TPA: hypothetical protein VMZ04_00060 [Anaerolineae bacterium]|nr:hypothetical protein [Anaerolineae bacterium]